MTSDDKILKVVDKSLVEHEKRLSLNEAAVSTNKADIEKINIYLAQDTNTINELRQQINGFGVRQDKQNETILAEIRGLRDVNLTNAGDLKTFRLEIARDILEEADRRYASKSVQRNIAAIGSVVTAALVVAFLKLILK